MTVIVFAFFVAATSKSAPAFQIRHQADQSTLGGTLHKGPRSGYVLATAPSLQESYIG